MRIRFMKGMWVPALVGMSLLLCAAPEAHALLRVAVSVDGGTAQLACDNDMCVGFTVPDTNPVVGILEVAPHSIGDISFQASVSAAVLAPPNNILASSNTTIANNGAVEHTVLAAISATGFPGPSVTAITTASGTWVNGGGSQILLNWFDDPANGQGAESPTDTPGDLIDTFQASAIVNPVSFSHNGGPFDVNDPGLFSMTLQYELTLDPGARLISRGQAESKPQEPPPFVAICHNIGGPRDLGANCDMTGTCTYRTDGVDIPLGPNQFLGIIIGFKQDRGGALAAHIAHGDGPIVATFEPPLHLASEIGPHRASNVECIGERIIPQPPEPGN
jgi:hypothetical protein